MSSSFNTKYDVEVVEVDDCSVSIMYYSVCDNGL